MIKQDLVEMFQLDLSDEQLDKLKLWQEASIGYYGEETIMSDNEYDLLTEELISFNNESLTEIIKSTIVKKESLESVADMGTQEMISLKKLKYRSRADVVEINSFFRTNNTNQKPLYYSPKFDGCSLKINWDLTNKKILRIITRGGLDVTNNLKNHLEILESIKFEKEIVCGELCCAKTIFNEKYSSENGGDYENARNFVGGLVKKGSLSTNIVNDLCFIPCTDGTNPVGDVWTKIDNTQILYSIDALYAKYNAPEFKTLCDGVVLAFFEDGDRRVKDNYPLNMLACKFPAPQAKTKVIGIEWTQKKSGNLTPKCILEPVDLDGSTVRKANGYNYEMMLNKHIGIGSEVLIEKSGDIIPVVVKVLLKSDTLTMPDCEYVRDGKHLRALDLEESRKFKFISAIKIMNIEGIGETIAEKLGSKIDYNILEIFNQDHKPMFCELLGGGANWQKFSDIYNVKTLTLDRIINLLQFKQVGIILSKKVALLILKMSNDVSNIPSYVLTNVCRGEGFQQINTAIKTLAGYGIKTIKPMINDGSDDYINFEMSLDPPGMSKTEFVKKFKQLYPNSEHVSLTKDTKYLFTNTLNSNTGKINKARKYNIKIVLYSDALKGKL